VIRGELSGANSTLTLSLRAMGLVVKYFFGAENPLKNGPIFLDG
jgi:hypothetical protein